MNSILLAVLLAVQDPTLEDVLKRATDYVTKYEAELGNLIGSEEYVQNAAWTSSGGRMSLITKRQQRRTSSDFLILQVGPEWTGLRKVNWVDGSRVKEEQPNFEDAFDTSPAGNMKRLKSLTDESARYNIGDVYRAINLPTFALSVMRKEFVSHVEFEKTGTERINGVLTWEVRFRETVGPTLVRGKTRELLSSGKLWIQPETGNILKTELEVENPYDNPERIRARIVVTYSQGKKVNMLVPDLMQEHYEFGGNTIDCRASYTNFRPFEVDVKFDISTTPRTVPPPQR